MRQRRRVLDPLGAWLTLAEASHLTGLPEHVLLDRALIGAIRGRMLFGLEYVATEDAIALLVSREGVPTGRAFRLRDADQDLRWEMR
jgi:hypothetical protein